MTVQVFDYGMNGEGIAKSNGKIILIPQAIIGEEVEYKIIENNNNYSLANLSIVHNPSTNRTTPSCPYFGLCGGCDLQHMKYDEQLKFKTLLVKKTLKKIANISIDVKPTLPSEKVYKYRNKICFDIQNDKIGFYKSNSKEIIEIDKCYLVDDIFNDILNIFKKYIKKHSGLLKNIIIREILGQILVGVVAKKPINLTDFYKELSKQFKNIGLYLIINTRKDSVVISGKINHIAGIKEICVNNYGLTYFVDIASFHQTNIDIQNKIYEYVLEYIQPDDIVVNGFSGQGLLSAIIAKRAKKVIGIEIDSHSHKAAENLKRDNKINNLTNIKGDFNYKFSEFKTCDTLILDPSKKGCGKKVMEQVKGVKNIIYISCNPIALAKDLREIINDYEIEEIQPFDMFPNTKNVETFVKLTLRKS